jgi:hypothetical protein
MRGEMWIGSEDIMAAKTKSINPKTYLNYQPITKKT